MKTMTYQQADASSAPTQRAIRLELLKRLGHQWRVGDRLPPIKELARQLGTGQSNTQRAVRQLASQGLLVSRQRQGTFVIRTPDQSMRLEDVPTKVFDLSNRTVRIYHSRTEPEGLIRRMMSSFRAVFETTGARILRSTMPDHNMEFEIDAEADAVVLFNPQGAQPMTRPEQFLTIVTTAMRMAMPRQGVYDLVSIDDHHGGMLAGAALAARGCKRVAFLGRILAPGKTRYDATSTVRLYGLEAGWGKSIEDAHMLYSHNYNPVAVGEMFHEYLKLKPRPDGIFAASDDLAIGFIASAAAHGLRAGRDYQIVGFDGQERGRRLGEQSLTSVLVPAEEMGKRAAHMLMERFANPDQPTHRVQLDCAIQCGTTTRATA